MIHSLEYPGPSRAGLVYSPEDVVAAGVPPFDCPALLAYSLEWVIAAGGKFTDSGEWVA